MNESMQNRLKSPVFWTSLAAQILSLLVFFEVIDLDLSNSVSHGICAFLELLVTFGILNNPTNRKAF